MHSGEHELLQCHVQADKGWSEERNYPTEQQRVFSLGRPVMRLMLALLAPGVQCVIHHHAML